MEDTKIPEVSISDNKVILPTIEVPLIINSPEVDENGKQVMKSKEVKITMQKLASGVRRDLANRHSTNKIVGQQMQGSVDGPGFQISVLSKVIIKAPFDITEKMIESFPDEVVDYLYKQYSDWADDSKKKG